MNPFKSKTLRRSAWTAALCGMLFASVPLPPQAAYAKATADMTVYDDALSEAFANYGWADADLGNSAVVRTGSRSIRLDPDEGQALYLYKDRIMDAKEYESLQLWVNGGASGGQRFRLTLSLGGQAVAEIDSELLLPGGAAKNEWKQVNVPLAKYGVTGLIDGILIWGTGAQEPIYIDDIRFAAGSGGQEPQPEEPRKATALTFEDGQLALKAGQERGVKLYAAFEGGGSKEVTASARWSSSDDTVATVTYGVVKGLKAGSALLSAEYEGLKAQLPVKVAESEPVPPIEPVDGLSVYDDALSRTFTDYSWAEHSLEEQVVAHTGSASIRFKLDGEGALYLYSDRILSVNDYDRLSFWIRGSGAGGQSVKLALTAGGQTVAEKTLESWLPAGLPAGEWARVEVKLADLQLPNGIYDGLRFAGGTPNEQGTVYLDDIALLAKPVERVPVAEVRIDKPRLVMRPGDVQQLQSETFFTNGDTAIVSNKSAWNVDRSDVVTVTYGRLEARSPGIAKVTAVHEGFTAEAYVQVTDTISEPVYEDALTAGYRNQSWHDKDFANKEQKRSGSLSIKFEPDGWDGVWIAKDAKLAVDGYYGVQLSLHGGASGGQRLMLHLYDGGQSLGAVDLDRYLPEGGLPAGRWTDITVSLADLGVEFGTFDGLIVQAGTEDDQGAVYIDDIALLRNPHPGQLPEPKLPVIGVKVDQASPRKPINSDIYGVNFDESNPTDSQLKFPVQRWGGNQTTRYNWELDIANRASDWFFMNYPYDNDRPGELPNGTTSDRFIDMTRQSGGKVLLTVPTIGWTPKDREIRYGYSQKKYGPQKGWIRDLPDAGNGVRLDDSWITNSDPTDTSKPVGVDFATRWLQHIAGRTGDYVNLYALDNEPEIWHVTHRDVHPNPPTYDELWEKTKTYGSAIKQQDPNAQLLGPVSWGWCAYFYSSADNCAEGPDRAAHDNMPFLEWYLKQASDYEKKPGGVRLVDYLDIHYYSQESAVPTEDESPEAAKRRFQSLKTLFDDRFVDQSWIQEPIRLIPRMKEMIAKYMPSVKLAITEYNFGNGSGITSGLAQAEALAIFGREGVDLATRFGNFRAGTSIEDAFKLFLDYDGRGSKIEGSSVGTSSTLFDAVGAYTIEGSDGKTYVLLFNKDTLTRQVSVDASMPVEDGAETYRFDAGTRLAHAGQVRAGADGTLSLSLPKRSATLIVIEPKGK
ncbi:glycoside hydrolase family 44 protein [Paenibacillus ginsengarvi]|uniref:BIG2 domain-containing protein n=1 Tax=Paenibacillus ginsengarvi TaxID=400777 RepID=A0A3B0BCV8_9BACL|nr:glycoside hydrolase family 44 protein [Paenibacillus ginsengarvi]RKN70600.1 hypothetical protein D7M11_30495 [Paenibacillus ginsengarvi]